ncbi:MAG TPA: 16S rRNA (uracil(1498)-N(3))-methyltransferase [Gallionella sp.]|nr:16S rRNA (uracil(1498)-N(3))-methyltransferase [Gallionella sp.]
MPCPRFYCPPPPHFCGVNFPQPESELPASGATFELPPQAAHHASRVLRLRAGDAVQVFDGGGHAVNAVISRIDGKRVVLEKLQPCAVEAQPPLHIALAQALSSSEKMDWVIQKATELGVAEIQPLSTERSVAKLSAERIVKRLEHWRQVAISACEQCGRNVLPEIHAPLDIMVWLQQMKKLPEELPAAKFILLPQGAVSLHGMTKPPGRAILLIGAEGGFTQAESDAALHCGFSPIRLGARILRTETAAIAGLAALQTLWGDFADL